VLEEFGNTRGERNWTIGGWRVGRFNGFVHGDNGGRFTAQGKGVGRPGPAEDGEKYVKVGNLGY